MALPVTDQLITQMMTENVRTQPTTPMEGNVSRPMIVSDLLSAMRDVNFNQLMEEYGNMAGAPSKESTPMTQGLMKEQSPQVPPTPLKQEQVQTAKEPQTQEKTPQMEEEIQVPTPMKNAMAMNTLAPTGSIEEPQKNTGLMSDTTQQIA
jgi:hypothetical protein